MVLAQGVEGDVSGYHELVVVLVVRKGGEVERPRREELGVGLGDPSRSIDQRLVLDIGAKSLEQGAHSRFGGVEIELRTIRDDAQGAGVAERARSRVDWHGITAAIYYKHVCSLEGSGGDRNPVHGASCADLEKSRAERQLPV
jgi:hypothetical protein